MSETTYPVLKREEVPVKQLTAVERSLAKPDAFAKPGSIGQQQKTRVRMLTAKLKSGRQRKRKRDPRDVRFF